MVFQTPSPSSFLFGNCASLIEMHDLLICTKAYDMLVRWEDIDVFVQSTGHFGFLIFMDLYGFITDILITLWSVIRIYTDL